MKNVMDADDIKTFVLLEIEIPCNEINSVLTGIELYRNEINSVADERTKIIMKE